MCYVVNEVENRVSTYKTGPLHKSSTQPHSQETRNKSETLRPVHK